MAAADGQWVSDLQYRCMTAGLGVVRSWVDAGQEQQETLLAALRREPVPGELVIGLATVSRLLAIELAAATGRTEREVLHRLDELTSELQRTGVDRHDSRGD